MTIAFLYAGQGSQHVGMGADLYKKYPAFTKVFDNTSLPFDLKQLCFEGPEEKLAQTAYTQPAMVAFAIGVTDVLAEAGIRPDYAAGLSLGEYSALYAAGVFDAATAIDLVAFRGRAMADASAGLDVAMAAVLGLDREILAGLCTQASSNGNGIVEIANYNCPGQLVISGERQAVEAASLSAREAGAKRCVPLKVSGPFHTRLMKPAGDALAAHFETVAFQPMEIPVIFNCLGDEKAPGDTIPHLLERQVQSSVFMEDTIRCLADKGVDTFIEIGPGKALSGFVRKTLKGVKPIAIETVEDIEKLKTLLG